MDKLKMQTKDNTQKNIEIIRELFPNAITETRDENNNIRHAVNFDLLKQELSDDIISDQEFYDFTWVGKRASIVEANKPIRKTLRPVPEESKDWENTKNLYIEGDNLDVLKLLQESYLNSIKMIYIDPPYNTGKDFIYKDNWKMSKEDYEEQINLHDDQGNRLFQNNESNGRFHSDWCSMIYPRLKLARNLLSEDGVIFISIDDNEVHNLRKICDEVFGEGNFIIVIIWKKRSTPPNDKIIGAQHDYIIGYSKNCDSTKLLLKERTDSQIRRYKNPDNHPKGPWVPGDLMANIKGGRYVKSLYFSIVNPRTGQEHYPSSNGNWRFSFAKIKNLMDNDEIYFGEDDKGRPKLKRFLCDVKSGVTWSSIWDFVPFNTVGSSEMTQIFGNLALFENPKPVGLLSNLLKLTTNQDSIILDFFSGSATTAHAVMQLNAEDGGNRKFIMVQLPEKCNEDSEAYKAGFKTISDIGKERIRRAGDKIRSELKGSNVDTGFRVFKLDSTNMKDVYYSPDKTTQKLLNGLDNNIKEGRTDLDLLYGVLIDWGVALDKNHKCEIIESKRVHFYDFGDNLENCALVACFESGITESIVRKIANKKPLRVVFRDGCFTNSADKINVTEIFKILSPVTTVRVI